MYFDRKGNFNIYNILLIDFDNILKKIASKHLISGYDLSVQ